MIQNFVLLATLSIVLFSCHSSPFDVDVSSIEIDQKYIRLDQEVFHSALDSTPELHGYLMEEFPVMYKEYFEKILLLGNSADTSSFGNLDLFKNNEVWLDVQGQIDSVFMNDGLLRKDIHNAFKHYRYYFPEREIPDIYFMNSGYNYNVYPNTSDLGIGLEWYLGFENSIIQAMPPDKFPNYLKRRMNRDFLVSNLMRGQLMVEFQDCVQGNKLINQCLFFGKIGYALNAMLPNEPEYLQFSYHENELEWCYDNEFEIWRTILKEDILYSDDRKQLVRFTGEAPFTQGFSEESPGRIGVFIGKQMVKDYMDRYPETELEDLLCKIEDMQILKNYKPQK